MSRVMTDEGITANLASAARGGDDSAFGKLVNLYEAQLRAHFMGITPSAPDAEELAHDTFVRAYMAIGTLKDPALFGPWLFGIARNVYREWSKDRRRHAEPPPPIEGERTEIRDRKALFHREIYAIVNELPDPYREVLSLRYFSGSSCEDIARMLERPLGTVTKQISRAHAMVAASLKRLQGFTTLLDFWLPAGEKKEDGRN